MKRLECIIETVSTVTDTRHDNTARIEYLVDGSDIEQDLGVLLGQHLDSLAGRTYGDKLDLGHAPLVQYLDGSISRAAGSNHGIQYNAFIDAAFAGQLIVVLDGLQGSFFSEQTQMPDLRIVQKVGGSRQQGQTGPKNGDQGVTTCDAVAGVLADRAGFLDAGGRYLEVLGDLVHEEVGDGVGEVADLPGSVGGTTQLGDLLPNDWMLAGKDVGHS